MWLERRRTTYNKNLFGYYHESLDLIILKCILERLSSLILQDGLARVQLELRIGQWSHVHKELAGSSSGVVERSKRKRLQSVKTILTGVAKVLYLQDDLL